MQDERGLLFTSGQFAKLCSTTKETLFHYDSLGLLKPARVRENGYRYYTASQFFDFDLIAVLRSAGCSLSEIREYMAHREPHAFVQLLRETERKLLFEQRKLEKMRRTLQNGRNAAEAALAGKTGVPWLEELPQGFYIATPVKGEMNTVGDVVRNMQDHITYCDQNQLGEELAVGSIVTKESLLQGSFWESYYSTRISQPVCSPWLYQRPAGLYACMLHKGPYERLPEASYPLLLDFIQKQGCRICGDAFETDLLSYLGTENEEDFILKLEIQVERL